MAVIQANKVIIPNPEGRLAHYKVKVSLVLVCNCRLKSLKVFEFEKKIQGAEYPQRLKLMPQSSLHPSIIPNFVNFLSNLFRKILDYTLNFIRGDLRQFLFFCMFALAIT